MQIVETVQDVRAYDFRGQLTYVMSAGRQYVLHDYEVRNALRDGAVRVLGSLDERLPRYGGQSLSNERLYVPFTGGLGDGLTQVSCLKALKDQYPDCTIDVSCPLIHHPVLRCFSDIAQPTEYPTPVSELTRYSAYASLEDMTEIIREHQSKPSHQNGLNNFELFSRTLQTPEVHEPVRLVLPSEIREPWDIGPSTTPRIGLVLSSADNMRSYPLKAFLKIAEGLIEKQMAVFFYGQSREIQHPIPDSPPWLCNCVDRTPNTETLAAMISQMDAVICSDGLCMHIGGLLRIPTLVIFLSSAARIAGGYPTVFTHFADYPCSPCGAVTSECPRKFPHCRVSEHPDMQPRRIIERLMGILQYARRNKNHSRVPAIH